MLTLFMVIALTSSTVWLYQEKGYDEAYTLKAMITAFENNPDAADINKIHQLLDKHLAKHPEDGLAHTFQGRLYFANKDYPASANAFEQAYAIMSDDPDLLLEYATTLYLGQLHPEKLSELVKALQNLDPFPYSAHSLLANIAMDNLEYRVAIVHWEALLDALPENSRERQPIQMMITTLDTYDRESQAETVPGQS